MPGQHVSEKKLKACAWKTKYQTEGIRQRGEGQRKVDKEIAHLRHLPVRYSNLPLPQGYSNPFVVKKSDPINSS